MIRALKALDEWESKGYPSTEKKIMEKVSFSKFHQVKKGDPSRQNVDDFFHRWRDNDLVESVREIKRAIQSGDLEMNAAVLKLVRNKCKRIMKKDSKLYSEIIELIDKCLTIEK